MELLGVGPTELIFIVIIALIVLGPKDLAKTGRTVGKWLNNLIQSDTWKTVKKTSQELRRLPTQLMREDNLKKFLIEEKPQPPATSSAGTWSGKIGTGFVPPSADPSTSLREVPHRGRTSLAPESENENRIHPPITVDGPPAEVLEPTKKKSSVTARKKSSPSKKPIKKPAAKPSSRAAGKKSNA